MPDILQIPCASCGAANRVPRERLGHVPVCGRCRGRLLGAEPVELDPAALARFAERSDMDVLVDFWAPRCGPCLSMASHFAEAARRLAGRALLAKMDTQRFPELAQRFAIASIPTLVLLRSGREVARASGAMQAAQIVDWLGRQGT